MPFVSCIVPVYNEGPRLASVLRIVTAHALVDEVIVVDDHSIDDSLAVAKSFKNVRVIHHEKNFGKSRAIVTGITQSRGDIIFLLDGDLIGLVPEHVTALLQPVLLQQVVVSISLRQNTPWINHLIGVDLFSGERVFAKKIIIDHLDTISQLTRFGFETYINTIIIQQQYSIKIVPWNTVISPWKGHKQGLLLGLKNDCIMIRDILDIASPYQVLRQWIQFSCLRVKE